MRRSTSNPGPFSEDYLCSFNQKTQISAESFTKEWWTIISQSTPWQLTSKPLFLSFRSGTHITSRVCTISEAASRGKGRKFKLQCSKKLSTIKLMPMLFLWNLIAPKRTATKSRKTKTWSPPTLTTTISPNAQDQAASSPSKPLDPPSACSRWRKHRASTTSWRCCQKRGRQVTWRRWEEEKEWVFPRRRGEWWTVTPTFWSTWESWTAWCMDDSTDKS